MSDTEMLIMLKEEHKGNLKDITINPREVLSVKITDKKNRCMIEMLNGEQILVVGRLDEITNRLNNKKKFLLKG